MSKCGTIYGYRVHLKNGEQSCDSCREVHNAKSREYKRKRKTKCVNGHSLANAWIYPSGARLCRTCHPQVCGTPNGYRRHHRYNEHPCEACKRANADIYYLKKKCPNGHSLANAWVYPSGARVCRTCYPHECGTRSGYTRHLRYNETPCAACRRANADHSQSINKRRIRKKKNCPKGHPLSDEHITAGGRRFCPVCREARRKFDPAKCGTTAGAAAHRYYKVPSCEPCRKAEKLARELCRKPRESRAKPTPVRQPLSLPSWWDDYCKESA